MKLGLREANQHFSKAIKAVSAGKEVVQSVSVSALRPRIARQSGLAVFCEVTETVEHDGRQRAHDRWRYRSGVAPFDPTRTATERFDFRTRWKHVPSGVRAARGTDHREDHRFFVRGGRSFSFAVAAGDTCLCK